MMKLLPTRLKLRLHLAAVLFAALVGHGYAQNNLTNGLVAYYQFNGNANDMSGKGNHLLANGGSLTTDRFGQANSAYRITPGQYLYNNNLSFTLSPTNSYTFCIWVRIEVFDNTYRYPNLLRLDSEGSVSAEENPNMIRTCLVLNGDSNNQLTFEYLPTFASSSVRPQIGQWYALAGSVESNKLSLYINGQLSAQTNWSATSLLETIPTKLILGHWFPDFRANYRCDDVRIYKRALSAAEVAQLYASEAANTTLNLYPVLTIVGEVGKNYRIEATSDLVDTNVWTTLTNFTLPSSPYDFMDKSMPQPLRRFYRAFPVP